MKHHLIQYFWIFFALTLFCGFSTPLIAFAQTTVVASCHADCDNDGDVDTNDIGIWIRNVGATDISSDEGRGACDADRDGDVDTADYVNLMLEFGRRDCPDTDVPLCARSSWSETDTSIESFGAFDFYADPDWDRDGRPDDPTLCWLDDPYETGCHSSLGTTCGRSVRIQVEHLVYTSTQRYVAHEGWDQWRWLSPPSNPFAPPEWKRASVSVYGAELTLSPTDGCAPNSEEMVLVDWHRPDGGIRFSEQVSESPLELSLYDFNNGNHHEPLDVYQTVALSRPSTDQAPENAQNNGVFWVQESQHELASFGNWNWVYDPHRFYSTLWNAHLIGLNEVPRNLPDNEYRVELCPEPVGFCPTGDLAPAVQDHIDDIFDQEVGDSDNDTDAIEQESVGCSPGTCDYGSFCEYGTCKPLSAFNFATCNNSTMPMTTCMDCCLDETESCLAQTSEMQGECSDYCQDLEFGGELCLCACLAKALLNNTNCAIHAGTCEVGCVVP